MSVETAFIVVGALAALVIIWAVMRGLFALINLIYRLIFRWSL